MRLTRAASYAIHAAAHMAGLKKGEPMPSHIIAQKRDIPERFLLKVLKPMVSAGLLFSLKGPHGGYRLARPPHDITLLEIVEAIDGPIRGGIADESKNSLNRKVGQICIDASDQLRRHLNKYTLQDLIAKD